jgi:hypothetical protein
MAGVAGWHDDVRICLRRNTYGAALPLMRRAPLVVAGRLVRRSTADQANLIGPSADP